MPAHVFLADLPYDYSGVLSNTFPLRVGYVKPVMDRDLRVLPRNFGEYGGEKVFEGEFNLDV